MSETYIVEKTMTWRVQADSEEESILIADNHRGGDPYATTWHSRPAVQMELDQMDKEKGQNER